MMLSIIIFTLLSILTNPIKCDDSDNNTVISDKKTEMGSIFQSIILSCPQLINDANLSVILWKFDNNNNNKIIIPVPVNLPQSNDISTRIRGGVNGSLLIEKVEYGDSKVYLCEAYGPSSLLYRVYIDFIVIGPPLEFGSFSRVEGDTAAAESSLTFIWDINITRTNIVEKYNITLCKSLMTNDCQTVSLYHPQYSYVFHNLNPFSEYHASIIAINKDGVNKRRDVKARTGPGIPLARPYLVLTKVNERNVTLRIECSDCFKTEKMRGFLKYFLVQYKDRDKEVEVKLSNISKVTIENTIINLHPNKNYTFFVYASNGHKAGPQDSIKCYTKEDLPNSTKYIRTSDETANEMEIIWEPASDSYGPITGYILKVVDNNQIGKRDEQVFELGNNVRNYRLTGLKSRNPYTIKLAAKNSVGLSTFVETMAKTDRAVPLPPRINYVKIIQNFVRIAWKNLFPLNETAVLKYDICWEPFENYDFPKKCYGLSTAGDGLFRCLCPMNSTIHSVDIPIQYINLNHSKIKFWVRVKVPSDLCEHCKYLEATSDEQGLDVTAFQIRTDDKGGSFFNIWTLILLIIGCIIIFMVFIGIFFLRRHNQFKDIFLPNRQNGHYARPPGEFIEVFPRPLLQPKIIPLEKTPYPPIQVKDLVDHIRNFRSDDGAGFQGEFESIELMDTSRWSITYPNFKDNKMKNRYTNIFPYDHSRVILQNSSNGKSDYINASFVDGYNRRNAYIATQGPLPETIGDFWQMVYEQNSEIIVMISNFEERGRRKCEMYWVPNNAMCYGNISVRQIYHKKMAFYTERRFAIKNIRHKKNANKERTVYHYQYTDWRDFDVPPSSLPVLVFVKATIKHWSMNSGPIIVHCSAGVGRTGTYICIESQIRQMEIEHRINVRGFLEHIRQQRMKLVQTESQYTFIHDALYEYYLCPDHEIHKDIFSSIIFQWNVTDSQGFSKIEQQFQMCTEFEPTNYEYIECRRSYNLMKNRSKILPIESRRINISCEPGIEGSNYINASAIQGYWEMKEFIITQHPVEETESDLWKMVWDENCTIIILLSSENLPQFWPSHENDSRSYRWSRVNYCNSEENDNISQFDFLLSSPREDYALDCTMHRLKRWPTHVSDNGDLLRLLFKINSEKDHSPIIVIDDFGGYKAGIFVALSSLLNQLRNDDVVDIYFVMKMIHMERPHTFSSSDDLKFLYDFIDIVITNHNSYSFFSTPLPSFTPNGVCHTSAAVPVPKSTPLNNTSFISQYATLNTLGSKTSTISTFRRRASSAESEPFCSSNQSPVKSRIPQNNRISWNPGESRYSTAITDSFIDWSTSIGNGHYNGVAVPLQTQNNNNNSNNNNNNMMQIISNPVGDDSMVLPVAKIIISQNCHQDNLCLPIIDTVNISSSDL